MRGYLFFAVKKCRIYAACGVSQTPIYNEKEGGIHNMCEVLDRIEKKGREEGIKEGIEQGILSERERMIRMIYKRGYSVEQISEIVEMPEQAVKLIVGEPVII